MGSIPLLLFWLRLISSMSEVFQPTCLATVMQDQEIRALSLLKKSLAVADDSWPCDMHPCSGWVGVDCEGGHVVSICLAALHPSIVLHKYQTRILNYVFEALPFLYHFNASRVPFLDGLPPALFHLSQLELLDLSATTLQGTIPSSLGKLVNLKFLSLAYNNLTGSIPCGLSTLFNLRYIDLSYNLLMGPLSDVFLSNLSQLVSIDLSHNLIAGALPPALWRLENLQFLALGDNLLQGSLHPQPLNWSHLNHLDLSNNQLSGCLSSTISRLKSLSTLNLGSNYFNGSIPSSISSCTGLQVLILSHNILRGELPSSLISLTSLTILDLSFNALTGSLPPGLFTLQNLQLLNVSHNLFYGLLPSKRVSMRSLPSIDLSVNFLSGSTGGIFPLVATRKNCFYDVPEQHGKRACWLFYSRIKPAWDTQLPNSVSPPGNTSLSQRTENQGSKGNHFIIILGGATAGAFLLVCAAALVICVNRYDEQMEQKVKDQILEGEAARSASLEKESWPCSHTSLGEAFPFELLQHATGSFSSSSMLANGQSGEFYKGILDQGVPVVVKRIKSTEMIELCLQELEVFKRASHSRIVPLLGYCMDVPEHKFLVYKYMPNGDLATALHGRKATSDECCRTSLDWIIRLKIAVGAAEGLAYLHHECSPPIVHRNVKASSVLLDDGYEVRLGSLSHARIQDKLPHSGLFARLLGFSQSLDQVDAGPEVVLQSMDVYNFGKILLEIISGKTGISDWHHPEIDQWVNWALSLIEVHDKEPLFQLLDPTLIVDEDLLNEVWAVAIVAKACLHGKPSRRPTMQDVLKALENPCRVILREDGWERMILRTSSHSSWIFQACTSGGSSQHSQTAEITKEESIQKSTLLVQNISYNSEIGECSNADIEELN